MLKQTWATQLLLGLLLIALMRLGTAAPFIQGKHYDVLDSPLEIALKPGQQGSVLEFFSYACIHCYKFDPALKQWLATKPDNISFEAIPVIFNSGWREYAKAFYAAQFLNLSEQTHDAIYAQVHSHKQPLNSEKKMAAFFAQHGDSAQEYPKIANSFAVMSRVNRAEALTRQARIPGTPNIVINGKYRTGLDQAGSPDSLFELIQYLVNLDQHTADLSN